MSASQKQEPNNSTEKTAMRRRLIGKRLLAGAGVLAICAGLLILLNAGYFWARIQYRLERPAGPAAVLTPAEPTGTIYPPNQLSIPSLGIEVPVIYTTETTEKAYQEALINGVVHFPGTALPGEVGNVYIFGHSSDYLWSKGKYKTVFAVLPKIALGAEIRITDQSGMQHIYTVADKFVVEPSDVSVLSQNTDGKKLLTLQTSYPLGTALRRYIVTAELKEESRK
jgi:sortase A